MHKLEDHRRKYERLRTEKKLNKMERERKRQVFVESSCICSHPQIKKLHF